MSQLCRAAALALAAASLLLLAGCNNNPQQTAWREKRPDGSPWKVFYCSIPDEIRSLNP